jgi:hypothetical protein
MGRQDLVTAQKILDRDLVCSDSKEQNLQLFCQFAGRRSRDFVVNLRFSKVRRHK